MLSRSHLLALVSALAVASAARVAQADGCAPGQFVADDTEGHCCWPGQRWSREYGHCAGAPRCPPGWFGSGASCVTTPPPPPVPLPPPPPPSPDLDLRPPVTYPPGTELPYFGGQVPPGAHLEERSQKGLVTSGFVMLGASYAASVSGALLFIAILAQNGVTSCVNDLALGLIPLVGAAAGGIAATVNSQCVGNGGAGPLFIAGGSIVSGIQIAGLIMGIYGYKHKDRVLLIDVPTADNGHGGFEVALVPGAPGAVQGLSLVASF